MDRIELTESELLQALHEAREDAENPEGAITTRELSEAMGLNVRSVLELLRPLVQEGTVEPVRIAYTYIDGRRGRVSAYRWVG